MKQKLFFIFTVVVAALLMVTSCKKDTDDSNEDNALAFENPFECIEVNLGTADSLAILSQDSAAFECTDYWYREQNYNNGRCYETAITYMKVSAMGNLYVQTPQTVSMRDSYYDYTANAVDLSCSIVSVGAVDGLSKIESIPERGWATQVAINQGHGYIVRMEGECYYGYFSCYARVYVKQQLGGGVTIQYQPDWKRNYIAKSKMKKLLETLKDQYMADII